MLFVSEAFRLLGRLAILSWSGAKANVRDVYAESSPDICPLILLAQVDSGRGSGMLYLF
jgi:hypothetical protein